ncbi:MAG: PHP domain-containing protein [Burkholderiales bacterium]|nr:PHP domain-containing protein [Burkholderiales bacterium]
MIYGSSTSSSALLNADLHSHSTISDGLLTPAALAHRMAELKVELFALTDHDDVRGLAEAGEEAARLGVAFVNGVEISVTWGTATLHILGLNIDPNNAALQAGLASVREGRTIRAQRMADDFARVGIPGSLAGADRYVTNKDMVSRTHFARFLVAEGIVPDVKSAFKHYLVKGKPGFAAHQWASLADAVQWIRAAQGVAVIAHPGRYKMGANPMRRLLGEFKEAGGQGLEVVTSNHTPEQIRHYAGLAKNFGLAASRGSDYHGPGESYTLPGRLPDLPATLQPVWEMWR